MGQCCHPVGAYRHCTTLPVPEVRTQATLEFRINATLQDCIHRNKTEQKPAGSLLRVQPK